MQGISPKASNGNFINMHVYRSIKWTVTHMNTTIMFIPLETLSSAFDRSNSCPSKQPTLDVIPMCTAMKQRSLDEGRLTSHTSGGAILATEETPNRHYGSEERVGLPSSVPFTETSLSSGYVHAQVSVAKHIVSEMRLGETTGLTICPDAVLNGQTSLLIDRTCFINALVPYQNVWNTKLHTPCMTIKSHECQSS